MVGSGMAAPGGTPLLGGLEMTHASCQRVAAGLEGGGCAGGDGSKRHPSSPTQNSLSPVGEAWRTQRPSSLTLRCGCRRRAAVLARRAVA